MLVDVQDGCCRSCSGQVEITDADDVTMTVECTDCGDTYTVETDAFNDGGIHYWPHFMDRQMEHGHE